jgi:sulfide dehydrogenase [flavocytochrome c] flavoprotein subunit
MPSGSGAARTSPGVLEYGKLGSMRQQLAPNRRDIGKLGGKLGLAVAGALWAPAVLAGGGGARVVIVGGGPGGVAVARALAAGYSDLDITIVEANNAYVTPFFSNRYVAGLWPLDKITFTYGRLAAVAGIRLVHDRAMAIDVDRRQVRLEGGAVLAYDRLVVATGADLIYDAIDGYGPAAETALPHAYHGADAGQLTLLYDQLQAMDDGGLVAVTVPKRPYPCHPAPYERASLIAEWLQRHKPTSKVLVLDSNETFPQMEIMLGAWERDFGDLIEWRPGDFGGAVEAVDGASRTLITADESVMADVGNVIPPQRAGWLATQTGLADASGWCPIDPVGLESMVAPNIHVLGDACDPGDMPRSAYGAFSQAQVCATAIGNAVGGASRTPPEYSNSCYFLLRHGSALVIGGRYQPEAGRITGIEGYSSAVDEDDAARAATAEAAERWYDDLTKALFG